MENKCSYTTVSGILNCPLSSWVGSTSATIIVQLHFHFYHDQAQNIFCNLLLTPGCMVVFMCFLYFVIFFYLLRIVLLFYIFGKLFLFHYSNTLFAQRLVWLVYYKLIFNLTGMKKIPISTFTIQLHIAKNRLLVTYNQHILKRL